MIIYGMISFLISASLDPLIFVLSLIITYFFVKFGLLQNKINKLKTILFSILTIGFLRFAVQGAMLTSMRRGVSGFEPFAGKLFFVSFGVAIIHVLISYFLINYSRKFIGKNE